MGVQIYTGILLGISGLVLFSELVKDDSNAARTTLLSVCFQLPMMGRVFGWW
jgi:hypothetical protein